MKRILLLVILSVSLISCSKDDKVESGALEVTLSYYFNEYQGNKPDVGASIYLFKQEGKSIDYEESSMRIGLLQYKGESEHTRNVYNATADVYGKAVINEVLYGDYLLVAASKGRFIFSVKPITINKSQTNEVKNFGYKKEFDKNGESW